MFLKKFSFVAVLVTLLMLPSSLHAQFVAGKSYLGPTIGLSFLGSTPEFGINYEYGMKLQNFGTVGIGGLFRYWGYSETIFDGEWKYTNILIGAQGNYHFNTDGSKFDPWLGIVLAYDAGSVSWSGPYGNYATPAYGGFWSALQAGARYWISPTLALRASFGLGTLSYEALDLGVDFKF